MALGVQANVSTQRKWFCVAVEYRLVSTVGQCPFQVKYPQYGDGLLMKQLLFHVFIFLKGRGANFADENIQPRYVVYERADIT